MSTNIASLSDRLLLKTVRFFNAEWSGALLAVVVLSLAFGIVSGGSFFAPANMMQIVISGADIGLIAAGMTIVILTAGIDLSVGSILVLVTSVVGFVASYFGLDPVSAILVGLAVGILVGMFQGGLVAYAGMPAFIVTLAGLSIWRGMANYMTKAKTSPPLDPFFKYFGSYNPLQGFRDPLPSYISEDIKDMGFWSRLWEWMFGDKFSELTSGQVVEVFWLSGLSGMQAAFFIHIGFFLILAIMLSNMKIGRYIYAIGSNEQGSRQAGINTKFYLLLAYVICALCAAMGGIVRLGLSSTATPLLGSQYELLAIAAVVIGGTSLFGGRGTIWGTFLGVLLLKIINNGFIQSGLAGSSNEGTFVQMMLTGTIILIAVGMDIVRQSRDPISIRKFLIGASSACVLLVALVPAAQTFKAGVALISHSAQTKLLAESKIQNASIAKELAIAKEKQLEARKAYDPFKKLISQARAPINKANKEIRDLVASNAPQSEIDAVNARIEGLNKTLHDLRKQSAAEELAYQKSRIAFNNLNKQNTRIDQKQSSRILKLDALEIARRKVNENKLLIILLFATLVFGIIALLGSKDKAAYIYAGLLGAVFLTLLFTGFVYLVPLMVLAIILLAAAMIVKRLSVRAKELMTPA